MADNDKKRKLDDVFDGFAKDAIKQARRDHVPGVLLQLVCRDAASVWKKDDLFENELHARVDKFDLDDMSVVINGKRFELALMSEDVIYTKRHDGCCFERREDEEGEEEEEDDEDYDPGEEKEEEYDGIIAVDDEDEDEDAAAVDDENEEADVSQKIDDQ